MNGRQGMQAAVQTIQARGDDSTALITRTIGGARALYAAVKVNGGQLAVLIDNSRDAVVIRFYPDGSLDLFAPVGRDGSESYRFQLNDVLPHRLVGTLADRIRTLLEVADKAQMVVDRGLRAHRAAASDAIGALARETDKLHAQCKRLTDLIGD